MRARALLLVLVAGILSPMLGAASALADPPASARLEARSSVEMAGELLARAIAIRYACDSRARIDLWMRDGRGGERHRRIQTIAKYSRLLKFEESRRRQLHVLCKWSPGQYQP